MNQRIIFLLSMSLMALTAACSSTEEAGENEPIQELPESGVSELQVLVVSDDFAVGRPRIPFVVQDGYEKVADIQRVGLTAFDLSIENPAPSWTGEAENFSDYEVPYWIARPDLSHAGTWGLAAEIVRENGDIVKAQFAIRVGEQPASPALGTAAPKSENRTLATEPDLAKLTSGTDPIPALYEMTVAEAVDSNRPTVVVLATPAFCQSRICAPVVRTVEAVYGELGDQANFIHLEIYKDFQELTLADEVEEWGLTSEPWIFLLDSAGTVAARLGGPVSPRELTAALSPLLS